MNEVTTSAEDQQPGCSQQPGCFRAQLTSVVQGDGIMEMVVYDDSNAIGLIP